MVHTRSLLIGVVVGAGITIAGASVPSCKKPKKTPTEDKTGDPTALPAQSLPPQSAADLETPVAKIDDMVITVGDFQDRINRQSPYIRARYTSLEQKREFLDNMVRFEVLAKEAFRRGLDKDPDVVRTMKQVMIQKLMKDQFENAIKPEDITDAEMRAFYEEHRDEYNKPEEVRVSAIIVKGKAVADKVAADALSDKGSTNKGFRELVTAHSTDETTKVRGGDLRYFDRETKEVPPEVVEAAFALTRTGEVAGPIKANDGRFYVIKQTGRRKALVKEFDEVKRQIQNRLYRDKRTQSQKDFIDELRSKAEITIDDSALKKVRVDTSNAGAKGGHGHGQQPPSEAPSEF